ncbi:Hypothetical protein D9617_25g061980 [Elsinoe fawcettii]|nr:Hypothetical protein D9617_25g061980 [Elsinoe fawcettii]
MVHYKALVATLAILPFALAVPLPAADAEATASLNLLQCEPLPIAELAAGDIGAETTSIVEEVEAVKRDAQLYRGCGALQQLGE